MDLYYLDVRDPFLCILRSYIYQQHKTEIANVLAISAVNVGAQEFFFPSANLNFMGRARTD